MAVAALVADFVHQLPHEKNTESTNRPVFDRQRRIRRRLAKRVKLWSIVGNRDGYTLLIGGCSDDTIRTGFARFFLGSVASRVLAISSCPVLTVPGK